MTITGTRKVVGFGIALTLITVVMLQVFAQTPSKTPTAGPPTDEDFHRLYAEQASILKRGAALLTQQEDFIKKQDLAFRHYEKILETWERQQQQYQRYLDSLSKR